MIIMLQFLGSEYMMMMMFNVNRAWNRKRCVDLPIQIGLSGPAPRTPSPRIETIFKNTIALFLATGGIPWLGETGEVSIVMKEHW